MISSSKKKRVSRIESSDEDLPLSLTPDNQENEDDDPSCRKSSRIKQRQSKVFQKPTRDDIWDKIPSSSEKDLSRITPTKKINNFTKVFSSYNAESYDLFNDEFINDEEEIDFDSSSISTDSEEEEQVEKKRRKKKNKIKNRRKRLKFESSSSDDEIDKKPKNLTDSEETTNVEGGNSSLNQQKGDNLDIEGDNSSLTPIKGNNLNAEGGNSSLRGNKGGNLSDESDIQVIESRGDNSQVGNEESDDENQIVFHHIKNKTILKSDSDSDENFNKIGEKEKNSVVNSENSDESEEDSESDNLSRSEKQLAEKQNRFQNFKEAQAKFKEKQRRLSMAEPVVLKQK